MRPERGRSMMSEINVTPLVDVMLVLLIIFMVTAPLMHQGLDVELPNAKGKELPSEQRIDITIVKDGSIQLDGGRVTMEQLGRKLREMNASQPSVFLRADKSVPYGLVVEVMAEIKGAGLERLGMVTEPKISIQ